MTEEHSTPIKTPKQLIIVLVLAFAVPITLFVLLSQLVTGVRPAGSSESETGVLERIKPVGEVKLADATGPKGNMTGEQVFQAVCKTCHEGGLAGAHKFSDKGAWAKVIAQGPALTYQHALSGIRAMPARGGNPDLSDAEVERGVVYMVNKAGASWKEPAAAVATASPNTKAAPSAPAALAAASASAAKPGAPLDLKQAEEMMKKDGCAACHAVDKKIIGPAYQDVAAKYKNDKDALAKLTQKVKAGGADVWGSVPMPPNAQVPGEDITVLVSWILTLKK